MKRVISLLAATAIGLAGLVAQSAPASAAVTSKTITKSFSRSTTFYSKPLQRCVRATISGTMSAFYVRSTQTYPTPADYQSLQNPTLSKPRVAVTTTKTCGSGSPRATVTKATLRQTYYYWKCSSNPQLSVSYPWSISASVSTPTCGKETVARRSTTYDVTNSAYTQYNSGVSAKWKKLSYGKTSTTVSSCLRGVVDVTVYRSNRSDSGRFDLGNICISV